MKIHCPHCGVKGSADDSYRGKQVKCPKCQGVFTALTAIAEPPPKIDQTPPNVEQPAEVEKSVEPEAVISSAVVEDVAEVPEQQEDVADDAWLEEEISDILAAEDAPEGDRSQPEASVEPVAPQEDVFNWKDIALEIDEEMAKGVEETKKEDGDPASLSEFFTDDAPAADFMEQKEGQRVEPLAEAVMPVVDGEAVALLQPTPPAPPLPAGLPKKEGPAVEKPAKKEIETEPYGMDKEQCWQCGKKDSVGVPFIAKDGRLYCSDCLPRETSEAEAQADDLPLDYQKSEGVGKAAVAPEKPRCSFTIIGLLKEAWAQTKGVKATIWAGSAVMYLTLLILVAGGSILLPPQINSHGGVNIAGVLGNALLQLLINVMMVIFSAGLLLIGIRKVEGEAIAWKMVFEGFAVAGKLVVATILQTLLIFIGFLLLVLPGIYLVIGYAMTIPLIVDQKMSPWQAMETSRKAIHVKWWRFFGLYLVMGLIFIVSTMLLGLGLIWTWPMFIVLGGVVYHSLFRMDNRAE